MLSSAVDIGLEIVGYLGWLVASFTGDDPLYNLGLIF
ncbi:Uncharacterised protein [Corynebacterium pilosum]|uniref:Uncharacterized protein n=1 Tax=Corynebacterium pilosum TaxID=35756 RepID=A0A376CMW2_9CORY|nr:Uncharacterised protein [Corynebacterium pilosum]